MPKTEPVSPEQVRVAEEARARLRALGIMMTRDDSTDDIANVLERVDAFEDAVERAGGDRMVDEPPGGSDVQPDDPRFVLPARRHGEGAAQYISRLDSATRALSGAHRPPS